MSESVKNTLTSILAELSDLYSRIDENEVAKFIDALEQSPALFVAGAGRSGLLLRCFAMRMMHMGKQTYMIGDVTTPSAQPGDLLLIGSGSGETGSLTMMAKKAVQLGVSVALITTNPASSIAALSSVTVTIPAPTPKAASVVETATSAQPMGNLFEQGMFLLLDAVVIRLMVRSGLDSNTMFKRHANLE